MTAAAMRICVKVRNREAFKAFNTWLQGHRELKSRRAIMQRVVLRITHRTLHPAFSRWLFATCESTRHRVSAARVCAKLQNRGMSMAFETWLQDHVDRKRKKQVIARVIGHWVDHLLESSWKKWVSEWIVGRRHRYLMQRTGMRIQNQGMSKAFETWVQGHVDLKRKKQAIARVIGHWVDHLLASSWEKWVVVWQWGTRNRYVHHRVMHRAASRMTRSVLCPAFDLWLEASQNRRRRRQGLVQIVKRMKFRMGFAVLLRWSQDTQTRRRNRKIISRIAHRMLQRGLSKAWSRWLENVDELRRNRKVIFRIAHRMLQRGLSKAWSRWLENMDESTAAKWHASQEQLKLSKVGRLWAKTARASQSCVMAAWAWFALEYQRNRRKAMAELAFGRSNRTLASGFLFWHAASDRAKLDSVLEVKGQEILGRRLRAQLAGSFCKWMDVIIGRRVYSHKMRFLRALFLKNASATVFGVWCIRSQAAASRKRLLSRVNAWATSNRKKKNHVLRRNFLRKWCIASKLQARLIMVCLRIGARLSTVLLQTAFDSWWEYIEERVNEYALAWKERKIQRQILQSDMPRNILTAYFAQWQQSFGYRRDRRSKGRIIVKAIHAAHKKHVLVACFGLWWNATTDHVHYAQKWWRAIRDSQRALLRRAIIIWAETARVSSISHLRHIAAKILKWKGHSSYTDRYLASLHSNSLMRMLQNDSDEIAVTMLHRWAAHAREAKRLQVAVSGMIIKTDSDAFNGTVLKQFNFDHSLPNSPLAASQSSPNSDSKAASDVLASHPSFAPTPMHVPSDARADQQPLNAGVRGVWMRSTGIVGRELDFLHDENESLRKQLIVAEQRTLQSAMDLSELTEQLQEQGAQTGKLEAQLSVAFDSIERLRAELNQQVQDTFEAQSQVELLNRLNADPVNLVLTLEIDFQEIGQEGSEKRKQFENGLNDELSEASGLPASSFVVKRMSPGSVIVDVDVIPAPHGPSPADAAAEIERQFSDINSRLRAGSLTGKIKAVRSKPALNLQATIATLNYSHHLEVQQLKEEKDAVIATLGVEMHRLRIDNEVAKQELATKRSSLSLQAQQAEQDKDWMATEIANKDEQIVTLCCQLEELQQLVEQNTQQMQDTMQAQQRLRKMHSEGEKERLQLEEKMRRLEVELEESGGTNRVLRDLAESTQVAVIAEKTKVFEEQQRISTTQKDHAAELRQLRSEHDEKLRTQSQQLIAEMKALEFGHRQELNKVNTDHDKHVQCLQDEAATKLRTVEAEHRQQVHTLQSEIHEHQRSQRDMQQTIVEQEAALVRHTATSESTTKTLSTVQQRLQELEQQRKEQSEICLNQRMTIQRLEGQLEAAEMKLRSSDLEHQNALEIARSDADFQRQGSHKKVEMLEQQLDKSLDQVAVSEREANRLRSELSTLEQQLAKAAVDKMVAKDAEEARVQRELRDLSRQHASELRKREQEMLDRAQAHNSEVEGVICNLQARIQSVSHKEEELKVLSAELERKQVQLVHHGEIIERLKELSLELVGVLRLNVFPPPARHQQHKFKSRTTLGITVLPTSHHIDQILVGGPAYNSNALSPGDEILEVNGDKVEGPTMLTEMLLGNDVPGQGLGFRV